MLALDRPSRNTKADREPRVPLIVRALAVIAIMVEPEAGARLSDQLGVPPTAIATE